MEPHRACGRRAAPCDSALCLPAPIRAYESAGSLMRNGDPVTPMEHTDGAHDGDVTPTDTPAGEPGATATATDDSPTFAGLGLPPDLLRAVEDLGFTTPTDIQAAAIPVLLRGRDVVGVAQTGTGKTAAFGLALLADVDPHLEAVQALVLAPTRELALQSADAITDFARRSRDVEVVAVYGGSSYVPQIRALQRGAQVVVGTPGRVMDLIERGSLKLGQVRHFVLDEADEMLRMGFAEDVEQIASSLPDERRTALFSATMPRAIKEVADRHLTDPVRVEISRPASTVASVHQTFAVVPFRHKNGALSRVLATRTADAALVFVRTKSTAEDVALDLAARGIQSAALSGDVAQRERERLVERLRNGSLDVLVATDVAARGLDVERIGLVVNYDVPRETDAYVHRIGRTGRAGRTGTALTFLTPRERSQLVRIERATGARLEEVPIPSPAEVSAHRTRGLLARAAERQARGRLGVYLTALREHLGEEPEVGDVLGLAAAALAVQVGDEGPAPRDRDDAPAHRDRDDAPAREQRPRVRREETVDEDGEFVAARFDGGYIPKERGPRRGESGPRRPRIAGEQGVRYRVDVGHKDGVQPGAIVGAITGESHLRGADVGRIQIFPSFSLVDISADVDEATRSKLGRAVVAGRALRLRVDEGPGTSARKPPRSDEPRTPYRGKGRVARREDSEGGYRGRDDRRGGYQGRREEGRAPYRGRDDDRRGGYQGRREH